MIGSNKSPSFKAVMVTITTSVLSEVCYIVWLIVVIGKVRLSGFCFYFQRNSPSWSIRKSEWGLCKVVILIQSMNNTTMEISRGESGPQRTNCEMTLLLNSIYHMTLQRPLRLVASFGLDAHEQCLVGAGPWKLWLVLLCQCTIT